MEALLIVVYSICGIYMLLDLKHDIHMLQQNSYRIKRFWRYLEHNDLSSIWRLCDLAMLFIIFSRLLLPSVSAVFVAIYCLSKIFLIQRRKFKKPLVFTRRVIRIYIVAGCVFVGLFLWAIFKLGFIPETDIYYSGPVLVLAILLLMSIFSWLIVIIAVVLLMPVEKSINNHYINDAKKILKNMPELKVIGITGSYGKTSTKHYLERILSEHFDVLMTPGSYNTPMGVVRTIREQMKPFYSVFICEMGAKQKGDIKEISDIVHPEIGIVTSVGPMHLETFKTIDNVRETKFELIDSLPPDGFAVVNNDFEECEKRKVDNVKCIRYSAEGDVKQNAEMVYADRISYTINGTDFTVELPGGKSLNLHTPLLGKCNVSNLLAAIIVADKLGMSEEEIKRGVASINQVEHRLSIKKTAGGVTIIDDAFNSNPTGSKMALEVLSQFKDGRRIIVTPGMIELGDKEYQLNKELGKCIGENSDIAIIVGSYNRESLLDGISTADNKNVEINVVDNFNEAQRLLSGILRSGDTVLYENDLPDTFK